MIPVSIDNALKNVFLPEDFDNKFELITQQLKTHGIVLFKKFLMKHDAKTIANKLGLIVENIDADNSGITEISNQRRGNNKKNSAAFTSEGLNLHTDRSPLENPPNLIMNWMCEKNCRGGQAVLVDSHQIFRKLKSENEVIIKILTHPDIACFTDGIDTFTGSIFQIDENNKLKVRFRYDQCSYFNLEAKEAVRIFQKTAKSLAHVIDFDIGAGYIIDNTRWLHGRNPFDGFRMVRRIHIMGAI